jgi:hypothetical protein
LLNTIGSALPRSGGSRRASGSHSPPGSETQQLPAGHGREDRGDTEHEHQRAKDTGQVPAFVHVAYLRQADHDPGSARHALQEPERDQRADVRREGAADRQHSERAKAGQQRGTPPDAVTDRAGDQLADGQPSQARGHRQLNQRLGGVQAGGNGRGRRQVHVRAISASLNVTISGMSSSYQRVPGGQSKRMGRPSVPAASETTCRIPPCIAAISRSSK